ncbi:MAG: UvrB/UvrC motif-containing protein [Kiritimatiellae bacterium]|nr:UvrB/UvrC motif-containing protein [Kiritimatiellia bacterium]
MRCDLCHQHEATIHLTQVINNDVRKLHLCEACARESGVDVDTPSLTDLLLGFGENPAATSPDEGRSCPVCHKTFADFKKTGRLGCPACYTTFETELTPMLQSMHRRVQHVGKHPSRAPAPPEPVRIPPPPAPAPDVPEAGAPPSPPKPEDIAALQRALDAAVAREEYEEAARLRDRIAAARAAASEGSA